MCTVYDRCPSVWDLLVLSSRPTRTLVLSERVSEPLVYSEEKGSFLHPRSPIRTTRRSRVRSNFGVLTPPSQLSTLSKRTTLKAKKTPSTTLTGFRDQETGKRQIIFFLALSVHPWTEEKTRIDPVRNIVERSIQKKKDFGSPHVLLKK